MHHSINFFIFKEYEGEQKKYITAWETLNIS